jgi:hypothetical protein
MKDPKYSALEDKASYLKDISKQPNDELLNKINNRIKEAGFVGNKIKIDGGPSSGPKNKQILDFEELGFEIDLNKPDFTKVGYNPADVELQTLSKTNARALYYILLCMQEPTWAKPENQEKKVTEIKTWNEKDLLIKLKYRLGKNQTPKCSQNIQVTGK